MGSQRVGHNWATFIHSLTDFLNCEKEILRYTWKRKYFLYKLVTQWMNNSTNQHFGRLSLIKRHGRCRFFLTTITSQDFKRIDKTFFSTSEKSHSPEHYSVGMFFMLAYSVRQDLRARWREPCSTISENILNTTLSIPFYHKNESALSKHQIYFFFFFFLQTSFGGLHWVFVAVHELSLVATSGGYLLLQCCTAWVWGHVGFSSGGTWA